MLRNIALHVQEAMTAQLLGAVRAGLTGRYSLAYQNGLD